MFFYTEVRLMEQNCSWMIDCACDVLDSNREKRKKNIKGSEKR